MTTKPRSMEEYKKDVNAKPTLKKEDIKIQKQPLGQKVKEVVLDEEAKNVGKYILYDVMIPTLKDTIFNMVTGALNLTFYGDSGVGRSNGSNKGFFDYGRNTVNHHTGASAVVNGRSADKITFASKQAAIEVLEYLQNETVEYQHVTLAAYYEVCGIRTKMVDYEFGWHDLSRVIIKRAGADGYFLDLPKPNKL